MSDIYMDVDVALSEVPVNIMPLIDDTDFKSREVSIAYGQDGMDLVWNFVTTAGAYTQTAVTPTTGGDYDWAHQGDGMYSIEIPATDPGGGSIWNDTEGFGWFTGYCTGVLPWRGPIIGLRAAGLNNVLIDSAYSATRGLAGTALPAAAADAAGGLPVSDGGELDLDTQLATTDQIGAAGVGLTEAGGDGDHLAEAGGDGDHLIAINLPNQTMDITGNLSGSVGSLTGHTNQTGDNFAIVNGAAGLVAIKAETVLIVEDTSEIQGKLPTNKFMGSSDGADDDGTLNTINTNAARLTAVRAAILTDWIDGGRLDLLLDAIKVVTDNLADAATTMISGTVSHDVTAASSTIFYSDDITEATADHFNGRIVIFLDGDLQYQATDITDYALVGAEGKFTVTELTEAPADNVTFVIV